MLCVPRLPKRSAAAATTSSQSGQSRTHARVTGAALSPSATRICAVLITATSPTRGRLENLVTGCAGRSTRGAGHILRGVPALVTFDCYGTLVDWEGGAAAFLYELSLRHGERSPRPGR